MQSGQGGSFPGADGVRGGVDDLLHQGRSGPKHADDEDEVVCLVACPWERTEPLSGEGLGEMLVRRPVGLRVEPAGRERVPQRPCLQGAGEIPRLFACPTRDEGQRATRFDRKAVAGQVLLSDLGGAHGIAEPHEHARVDRRDGGRVSPRLHVRFQDRPCPVGSSQPEAHLSLAGQRRLVDGVEFECPVVAVDRLHVTTQGRQHLGQQRLGVHALRRGLHRPTKQGLGLFVSPLDIADLTEHRQRLGVATLPCQDPPTEFLRETQLARTEAGQCLTEKRGVRVGGPHRINPGPGPRSSRNGRGPTRAG